MTARVFAFLLWDGVAASLAYWGLRWLAPPTGVPPQAGTVSLGRAAQGDLRKLLAAPAQAGAVAAEPSAAAALSGRLRLLGVVAPRQPADGGGLALLSLDGKPPRAVRAGAAVDGNLVLLSITQRSVEIGPASGPATVRLDLPALPAPATGTLAAAPGLTDPAER